jgi:uncharacterized protein YggL (DUF469 family)
MKGGDKMAKYKVIVHYEEEIEAEDIDEAIDKFLTSIEEEPQQDFYTFVVDNTKVVEE